MKQTNFILLALFLFLSAGQLWAQKQKPYKPAATFKGDTLGYLEYNYALRGEQYKGKAVEVILKELEYPVLYVKSIRLIGEGPSRLGGLYLVVREKMKQFFETMDYYVVVWFENPPTFDEYTEALGRNHDDALSQKLYDLIKDLKIANVSTNSFLFKNPENIKAWKEHHKRAMEKQYEEFRRAGMPEAEIKKLKKGFGD